MTSDDEHGRHIPIPELNPGDRVLQYFELRSRDLRTTRSGQEYLDLAFGDSSGVISAKMWADAIRKWGKEFNPGDFVKVIGRVESYRDKNQLVVDKIKLVEESDIPDIAEVVRTSDYEPSDAFMELVEKAALLNPRELADLVVEILKANEESFSSYPAARMIHHSYRGGLVEHTADVVRKAEAILDLEPDINRDVTIAGAILHDIGKIRELDPSRRGRTAEGRLVGHLILGLTLLKETAARLGLSDRPWLTEVEHCLVAHHGATQFGSPVPPLTREALVVHFADNLDSKLKIMKEALESVDPEGFSDYNKWLEGRVFRGGLTAEEDDNVGD